jgi:hypothetical protein
MENWLYYRYINIIDADVKEDTIESDNNELGFWHSE